MKSAVLWLAAGLAYIGFFAWYTNFDGPLTEEEIQGHLQVMRGNGHSSPEAIARMERFMRTDTGDDFVMINIVDMNEAPPTMPATGPGADADALLGHYMEHMYSAWVSRACHPVFAGPAVGDAMDLQGIEGAEHWEQAGLIRWRSRRDLVEIVLDPRFNERHGYKLHAITKTIAYPVEPSLHLGDPRLLLALLLTALTAVLQLLAFRR